MRRHNATSQFNMADSFGGKVSQINRGVTPRRGAVWRRGAANLTLPVTVMIGGVSAVGWQNFFLPKLAIWTFGLLSRR